MSTRKILFNRSELGVWKDDLLSCCWTVITTPEGDERLLAGDIAVTDAIRNIQIEIAYRDLHYERKELTLKMDRIESAADWKTFERHFGALLKKPLKASWEVTANGLFALKSFLWNKMTQALINLIKIEKGLEERKESEPMSWSYTFNEPLMTYDNVIWGNGNIRIDFSESKLNEAAQKWFANLKTSSKDAFGDYLLNYIYGTLTYKCSIPTNPDLIDCKVEEMSAGVFLEELDKRFCNSSKIAIKASLKSFLIDKFWIEDYRLPPVTAKILQELSATKNQKEQIANELKTILELSSFPIDNYIEESKLQAATTLLKKQLRNFRLQTVVDCASANFPTIYEATCDFAEYHFSVTLNMKSSRIVESFEIKIDSEEKTIFNTTFACCKTNEGEFVAVMSRYLGDAYMAKAFKRHIEYKIDSSTGREIKWRA